MTSTKQLEFNGSIERNPVAELFIECAQKGLTGSLRLASGDMKSIVYFEGGNLVFAVSNARRHRLFEILLEQDQIEKSVITAIEGFTNDLHLAKKLVEMDLFSGSTLNAVFDVQISSILNDAVKWTEGQFVFSASARIKADIHFDYDIRKFLKSYVESQTDDQLLARFENEKEKFRLRDAALLSSTDLTPQEAFILSRLEKEMLTVDTLEALCGLDRSALLPMIYRLWTAGFVTRINWSSAFTPRDLSKMSGASFELIKSARSFEDDRKAAAEKAEEEAKQKAQETLEEENTERAKKEVTLEAYLENVENAATHYEIFEVSPDAKIAVIKNAYFSLAKRFHPDLFHRQVDEGLHSRVQKAFTEIAQAYETLKNDETREVYDFKLRKVLSQMREAESGQNEKLDRTEDAMSGHSEMAADNFASGYEHLLNDNFKMALPFLGRAVHLDGSNARYRAFYGRALASDPDSHRKAESELQQAVKMEPQNPNYRLMLAELLVDIGHLVRAKGELNRLLKMHPNNKEAQALLDSLEG